MTYRLAFDAANVHYPVWSDRLPWMLAAMAGMALIRWPSVYGEEKARFTRAFGGLLLIAGCALTVVLVLVDRGQRTLVVGALQQGHYQVVEGIAERFRPGDPNSHQPEEFDVAGHHFRYSAADQLYGFNQVAGAGGPMREGLQVRIAHIDGLIARLEIRP